MPGTERARAGTTTDTLHRTFAERRAAQPPLLGTPKDVPFYHQVEVGDTEVATAMDRLLHPRNSQQIHADLGHGASIDIAIHDDVFSRKYPGREFPLGQALGGTRRVLDASIDRSRLAQVLGFDMALKYLTLHDGLERGGAPEAVREAARHDGAKAVLWTDDPRALERARRVEVMQNYGRLVGELGGQYVPGVDIGTNYSDMSIANETAGGMPVSCKEGDIPTSKITAESVGHALDAGIEHKRRTSDDPTWQNLDMTTTFQGVGNVGHVLFADRFLKHENMKFIIIEPNAAQVERTMELLREKGVSDAEIRERVEVAHIADPTNQKQIDAARDAALAKSRLFIANAGPDQINQHTLSLMPEDSLYGGAANDLVVKEPEGYADDPDVLALAVQRRTTGIVAYQANMGGIAAIAVQDAGGTEEDAIRYMRGVYDIVLETLTEAHERREAPETVGVRRAAKHLAQYAKYHDISLN